MTQQLRRILEDAKGLSPGEQLQLIHSLSQFLQTSKHQSPTDKFFNPPSLEEIIESQGVLPVENLEDLKADFWPAEESIDDFVEFTAQQREEDRLKD